MPITFRCEKCRNKLSTAKRKAGSTVACPNCGVQTRVPSAATLDAEVEKLLATAARAPTAEAAPESPPPPPAPVADRPRPAALPSPAKLNDLPLFEREDFAELLEEDARDEHHREPLPLPPEPAPAPPAEGFFVSRGTAAMGLGAVAALLGLAFALGYLVGGAR